MGVVGLETAFGVLNTKLVKTGIITLEKLIDMMSVKPREIFGLPGGKIEVGAPADLALLDVDKNGVLTLKILSLWVGLHRLRIGIYKVKTF